MKKKNLFLATVIAVVGVSGLVFSRENISGYQFSDLELANIEALTRSEVAGDKIPCRSDAKRNSKKSYVDCSECIRIEGWEGTGTEATCTRRI